MVLRRLVRAGPLAPCTGTLCPPTPASPLAIFMEHHRPETLAEPKISEKPPMGRQLFPGPPE